MSHIAGTGRYLPERVLRNDEIAAAAGVSEEWVLRRTGIHSRHMAADGEGAVAMATHAGRAALESAGVTAEEIDLVVVATSTPDRLTPPTACELQARIGAWGAACFDMEAGFAGWIYALLTADSLLETGMARRALVVGVEKLSTVTDRSDQTTGPLFGDGAGAVVLAAGGGPLEIRSRSWWADGRLADALQRPSGGAMRPFDALVLEERSHLLKMEGSRIFRVAIRTMAQQAEAALRGAGITLADVGRVVPHQANLRILEGFAREMELPMERVHVNIDRYGNTGAATVPIALDETLREGTVPPDRPVLLVSFGAGATSGAAVLGPTAR